MKKIAALLLCVTMLAGCWTIPGVIRGISNLGGKVQAVLCDPSVDQVADAIAALAFLQQNPAIAAAVGAGIEVFRNIRDKICITIPQLQSALAQFDQAVGNMALKGVEAYPVPRLSALRKA